MAKNIPPDLPDPPNLSAIERFPEDELLDKVIAVTAGDDAMPDPAAEAFRAHSERLPETVNAFNVQRAGIGALPERPKPNEGIREKPEERAGSIRAFVREEINKVLAEMRKREEQREADVRRLNQSIAELIRLLS